jgi:DNA topoisomerase-1
MKDESNSTRRFSHGNDDADPVAAAQSAQLRYVGDWHPGLGRRRSKKTFVYIDVNGKRLRNREQLRRIKALAIPPAWSDVWIGPWAEGHLQATGRDARGRKQYRYHSRWREVRDENKYERMIAFGQILPRIRKQVESDLALSGLPRAKVLATVVKLLEVTHIRVGNEEYARNNQSFGLATLRNRHVKIAGGKLRFEFRGKSRVEHAIDLQDRRLARIIKRCHDLPGYDLFQYIDDDGARCAIEASDVNDYLREVAGAEFSTKDYRTWAGTVLAARALRQFEFSESQAKTKRNIAKAIQGVSQLLGNTRTVCRKCYVHPAVIQAYTSGTLDSPLLRAGAHNGRKQSLAPEEIALLALLQRKPRSSGRREKVLLKPRRRARGKFARLGSPFRNSGDTRKRQMAKARV